MKVHELRRCPGCHGATATTFALPPDDVRLQRCAGCGLVYAGAYGDPEEIYVEGYLKGETDFGLDLMHPTFQRYLAHAAGIRLRIIERAAGGTGSLLDVGCGSGELLAVAAERGWDATGVEPVAESAGIARERGVEVREGLLDDVGLPERSFDVVSAFHVLEHMPDAVGFLGMLARYARPGGLVAAEVPNWRSFHRRRRGSRWAGLRPLEHVGHYEPSTLEAAFRAAGLVDVRARTTGFLWEDQTLGQALDDLARPGWARLPLVGRDGTHDEQPAVVPTRAGWALLRTTEWVYDRARVGQVIIGVGRVP